MKKLLSILLICLIVPVSLLFVGCSTPEQGTENKVWRDMAVELPNYELVETEPDVFVKTIKISTAEELAGFAKAVNNGEKFTDITITLEADIDLQNILWDPIGYGSIDKLTGREFGRTFAGIFDGKNHTIYNLYIRTDKGGEEGGSGGVGLFGCVSGTVKNLKLVNADIEGNHWVGGIVGYMLHANQNIAKYDKTQGKIVCSEFRALTPNGGIDNCHAENVKVNCVYFSDGDSGDKAGAVIGFAYMSYVTNCSATNSLVMAGRDAGQVIGCVSGTVTTRLDTNEAVNWDYQTGNTAGEVAVSWNETGESTGANIQNEVLGKKA